MKVKFTILFILLLGLMSCGTYHTDKRMLPDPPSDDWVTVGQITTTVGDTSQGFDLADVTYIAGEVNVTTEDTTGLLTPATESDILDFGTYGFDTIKINKLKVCGTGNEKCTAARIIVYVSSANGGLYNSTDNYSVPMLINGTTEIGHLIGSANEIASYTIPANDRKLTNSDFGTVIWPLTADFSNGGAGSYGASITMAVQVQ